MKNICAVENCGRYVCAQTFCTMHYQRFIRHGNPLHVRQEQSLEERFWSKVNKTDGCWNWTAATAREGNVKGRGSIGVGSRTDGSRRLVLANRMAWILTYGPIPDDINVLHRCDNPPCVRPDHLFLGTQQQNMADMVAKGRQARGAMKASAILTESDVRRIREQVNSGKTRAEVARAEGISRPLVSMICSGKRWNHVA